MNYWAITGRLIARTATHVGTGEGGDVTDDLCRRDAQGRYLLPGTAVAGVLRTLATRLAPRLDRTAVCNALNAQGGSRQKPCGCKVCELFGELYPSEDEREGGRASRLLVAHAEAELPVDRRPRIRDHVGIGRSNRAAAREAGAKFDVEVLPAGTAFRFRLELEPAEDERTRELEERLLAAALAEWQAGRVWLGGRVARGLGAFKLEEVRRIERDLSNDDGLLAYLAQDEPWNSGESYAGWVQSTIDAVGPVADYTAKCKDQVARSFATVDFRLEVDSGFLSNDPTACALAGFDHAPLLATIAPDGRPILPGASLRGVLRAQAERIVRTLATYEAADQAEDTAGRAAVFGAICPACDPLARPDKEPQKTPLASCDSLLKGVVASDQEVAEAQLCLACCLFGTTRRGSRLLVEDAEAEAAMQDKVFDFLAIDRFTGGGKEGAKFDAVTAWRPVFPVRLYLENPAPWELGWLVLVLRDLAQGLLPVGFGAAKGFGAVKVELFRVGLGVLGDDDAQGLLGQANMALARKDSLYQECCLQWKVTKSEQDDGFLDLTRGWVRSFKDHYDEYIKEKRPQTLRLTKDSYFDGDLPDLYGVRAFECLLK